MQIESKLDKMQHMLAVGISPREIMKDLQLTERNYHWYRKKLEDRTFHNYYNKQQESYLEDLEECRMGYKMIGLMLLLNLECLMQKQNGEY